MTRKEIRDWFARRNYKIEFNSIEPVFRNKRVYAVASPNNGGGWNSFLDNKSIEKYIREQERLLF